MQPVRSLIKKIETNWKIIYQFQDLFSILIPEMLPFPIGNHVYILHFGSSSSKRTFFELDVTFDLGTKWR